MAHESQQTEQERPDSSEFCNEYIHQILSEWANNESQYSVVPLKSVKISLYPLLVSLRKHEIPQAQLDQLANVLHALESQDFHKAKQDYLTLSIGKGKFPIGLRNVGIHERKINQSDKDQNMVLDDWCVSIKRLVSYCEWQHSHAHS